MWRNAAREPHGDFTLRRSRPVRYLAASFTADRDTQERMHLDEEKLEALRRWGEGLRQAASEEHVAAGRAILMLIEDIERLHIDLSCAQQPGRAAPVVSDAAAEDLEGPVPSTLHERLQQVLGRDSDSEARAELSLEEAGSGVESDRPTTSPDSWIEALRRQK